MRVRLSGVSRWVWTIPDNDIVRGVPTPQPLDSLRRNELRAGTLRCERGHELHSCSPGNAEAIDRLPLMLACIRHSRLITNQDWKRRGSEGVTIHGWVYQLEDGTIRDLNVSQGPPGQVIGKKQASGGW